ncbi:MAG: MFS transporter [Cellulomonadaceae bacterium]|jgi:UMF1 family MFS transporter|nr:MFS transporter [Cellulomonadaceae bacterium]
MTDRKSRRQLKGASVAVVVEEDSVAANSSVAEHTPLVVVEEVEEYETPEVVVSPALAALEAEADESVPLDHGLETRYIPRQAVRAWALWDWATQPFSTIIITFVFIPLYLTSAAFLEPRVTDLPINDPVRVQALDQLAERIGGWIAIAGIITALLTPLLAQRAAALGRRKHWLAFANILLILVMFALFFMRPEPHFFTLAAALIALGTIVNTVANVNYNALLASVSTPKSVGRVSGYGWGAGFLAGLVTLIIIMILQVTGWFGMNVADGSPFRIVALACAIWAAVFAWPLYMYVPDQPKTERRGKRGLIRSYSSAVEMFRDLFENSRTTFWFLLASAIYRDGLTGIFTFGAILAVSSFGFRPEMVLLFGVAAYLIAGISTMLVGRLDNLQHARKVITISLAIILTSGMLLLIFHRLGAAVFWIFGLLLCALVGPAQAASRAFLSRVTPPGHEAEVFALYATTGKAAAFLSAAMWTIFIAAFGATIWGLMGILLVIAGGLGALIFLVKDRAVVPEGSQTSVADPVPVAL